MQEQAVDLRVRLKAAQIQQREIQGEDMEEEEDIIDIREPVEEEEELDKKSVVTMQPVGKKESHKEQKFVQEEAFVPKVIERNTATSPSDPHETKTESTKISKFLRDRKK